MKVLSIEQKYERLVATLKLLASPPNDQLAAFPQHVHRPDEIALTFDDAYGFVPELWTAGKFGYLTRESLEDVSALLDRMSGEGNAHLWTEESVKTAPEWTVVRSKVLELLLRLGETPGRPNLNWITFLRPKS